MRDEIVSLEVAKLAKKRGFNESGNYYYNNYEELDYFIFSDGSDYTKSDLEKEWLSKRYPNSIIAPTQSLLQRWLREKHNIYVTVDTIHTLVGTDVIKIEWKWSITSNTNDDIKCIWNGLNTYEKALEEGLYQALMLLK